MALISPYRFFSIDFPAANQTNKQTRSTTNPKATKGNTCTQYTQHILIIKVTLIYSCYLQTGKWLSDFFVLYIYIAIESWKSQGPQNLSTFNYSQTEEDKIQGVTLPALPTRIRLCLKKGFFSSRLKKNTLLHVAFLYRLSPSKTKRNTD